MILWSDQQTTFAGTILARGGANGGNGGFVETSGHTLEFTGGRVNTSAPNGTVGQWLLDPVNLTIDSAAAATISSNLANTSVTVQTNVDSASGPGITSPGAGDINVNASISWNTSTTLTLSAYQDIKISDGVQITSTGGGNLVLRADNLGRGAGTVIFTGDGTGHITMSGGGTASLYFNPSVNVPGVNPYSYVNPTEDYSSNITGNYKAYMLVNNASDLRNIQNNLSGTSGESSMIFGYALGKNVDATGFTGFASSASFNTAFDGSGGLGTNYTISNLTLSSSQPKASYGLFPIIGGSGAVSNLTLANVSISAGAGGQVIGALAGSNNGTISNVIVESGSVNGTAFSGVIAGGLVGQNEEGSSIRLSSASADVIGGVFSGGLAGRNAGEIAYSYATGALSSGNDVPENVLGAYGGLVGLNDTSGTISQSFATGAVSLVGPTSGYLDGGGLVGQNRGDIASSYATGAVFSQYSSPEHTYLGGLVGWNLNGSIEGSYATGAVTGIGQYGDGGGLVGVNTGGTVFQSYATGAVNITGASSTAGGFVGANTGSITQAFSTGSASVSDGGIVGGFAGSNSGRILQAYATGPVSGGVNSTVGGLVGSTSGGSIEQTYAIGKLSAGAGSTVGGLIGTSSGGDIINSYWDTQTTGVSTSAGGDGRPTTGLIAALPPGFVDYQSGGVWTIQPDPSYPYFPWQPNNTIPMTNEPVPPNIPSQQQIIDNLTNTVTFASLNTSPVVTTQNNGVRQPQFPPSLPPGAQPPPTGQTTDLFQQRVFDVPPLTETRFVADQVLLQIKCDIAVPRLEEEVRRLGLELMASQSLCTTTGTTALQFRITDGKTVRDVIRLLASVQIVAIAQPIYIYVAGQETAADPTVPASRGDPTQQQGDAAQYILQKLRIPDVHRIVRGTNVPIAVIDSEIDAAHPDLAGMVVQRFSAVGAPEKPHSHGTGMAGAIASHQRLMGMAPSSRIYAVHAFSPKAATAESTTYAILKGLDWATTQGVRIINMSFAGPKDPSLERAIKVAYDKGIVLIAAAGNAGPTSPPLYPGADPNVIAVTATDAQDKIFTGANRGKYVSVAAPGVDILVPAPDNAYQLTTGTSVAAAEVSGIVALLLERNPRLTPVDVRRILTGSARRLAPGDRTDEFGSGLVDPLKALQAADPRLVTSLPPLRQR